MIKYEKQIIDLKETSIINSFKFLRMEILNVQGFGPTFFGHVRYARNGIEQKEVLPMDLSKGIFIATLRDDQLEDLSREELEETLSKAAGEIATIVRKHLNLDTLYSDTAHFIHDYDDKCTTKESDKCSLHKLKDILMDYPYLVYDEQHSEPPDILRCRVNDPRHARHAKHIFEIADKFSTATNVDYKVGSYGGSSSEGDNLDEVWTNFSLRKFNFEEKTQED